ncbi:hypothetical protein [Stenoxybacter acetivorans]|uniref:hypothetical protein n=1 Tax=Stenoxybacter acetivorans TaxID=422441 RepID=UPI000567498E|nr:hypothetical protein [Stenoxybacter acetivorans]
MMNILVQATKTVGVFAALLFLSACGVETAATSAGVAKMEADSAQRAVRQKQQMEKQLNEAQQKMASQHQQIDDLTGSGKTAQ